MSPQVMAQLEVLGRNAIWEVPGVVTEFRNDELKKDIPSVI
jgi:hypothetical protein